MNAFFRQHLKNETKWEGMFTGEWKPTSVAQTGVGLYVQYQDPMHKAVDDFEGAVASWQSSTIGGSVTHNASLPVDPEEGKMHDHPSAPGLDPKSPHDTKGMKLRWDNLGDNLVFSIPSAHKDVSGYSVLSFRVAQKVDSPHNPANQAQNLRVALKDSSNNERAVRVSAFSEIPFPDHRANHTLSKSAMKTVRIPLASYMIVYAGQPKVDLKNIASLSFVFSEKSTGEIDIDNIEFTN
jgi:Carbohydrate binding domain (family 11)